ncbi:MAG: N-acetylmannosamine-6-phosphate 2-epimerase [Tissierellia bacterium]|nr:N-acetylmannosamine-6-phosphate 2-epimerase [Tissierellia bacterium]
MDRIDAIKDSLLVSCQALEDEPLHSSFIMGRMAKAALEGGAKGIRANGIEDIKEIKKNVDLPIIGIIKKVYDENPVYITPTSKEVDELVECGCDIIAVDATDRMRPDGKKLEEFFSEIKEKYPKQLFMADTSTVEEAVMADRLGFDFIGTTLVGYTENSKEDKIEADDFKILREIIEKVESPVIAEGNINTPEKAKRVLELGAYTVVVGGAITRPQLITKSFVNKINEVK